MSEKVLYNVYEGDKLINTSYCILRHEGHWEVIKDIYKRKGYTIKHI